MIRRHWTVQTLETCITEGESLLEEFAHSPEWLDLVRRELARKQRLLGKLRLMKCSGHRTRPPHSTSASPHYRGGSTGSKSVWAANYMHLFAVFRHS
jgi:hypothetical protein